MAIRTGELSQWLSQLQCVLSYFTVQPFISIFGLHSAMSRLFIGPVPLTLGLDAGQIDWKNARFLVPDTSLSIALASRREKKKFPLLTLLPSCSRLAHTHRHTHTRDGSVTKLSVIVMCISVVLSLPLTLPVD